jgi:predicted HTH domain antitoxin
LKIGSLGWRERKALELYRDKKVSLWRAARIAGLTLGEMLDIAEGEGIPAHVSVEDIEEDMRAAREAEEQ